MQAPLVDPALAVLPILAPAAPAAATAVGAAAAAAAATSRALLPGAELVALVWTAPGLHREPVQCLALLPEDAGTGGGFLDAHRLRVGAESAKPEHLGDAGDAALPPSRWIPPCLATSGYDCTVRVTQRGDGRNVGVLTVETTVTTGTVPPPPQPSTGGRRNGRPASPKRPGSPTQQQQLAAGGPQATVTRGRLWHVPIDASVLYERWAGEEALAGAPLHLCLTHLLPHPLSLRSRRAGP